MHFIGLCTIVAGLCFSSCQKDDLASSSDLVRPRAVSFTYSPDDTICLGDSVTITYNNGLANNCGQSTIQIWGPTDTTWVPVLQNEEPVNGEVSYTFTPDPAGTYLFRAHWVRAGSPMSCPDSPPQLPWEEANPLVVEDCTACDTLFTGEAISCDSTREAIYTFVFPDSIGYVKIQGGLTNFTGEDAVVTVAGGADVAITQSTPGNSSNRIITVEFSADACEEVTIQITWNSTNSDGVITGEWSAVDEDGVELAPEVPGLACE